jgi:hypothetical protein
MRRNILIAVCAFFVGGLTGTGVATQQASAVPTRATSTMDFIYR